VLVGDGEATEAPVPGGAEGHDARSPPEEAERDAPTIPHSWYVRSEGRAVRSSPTTKPVPELVSTTVTVVAEDTGDGERSSTRSVDG
jgi:hypothetical protein